MRVEKIAGGGEFATLELPLFTEAVAAGFPSPAGDYREAGLDLNELCVANPAATYFVRAQGDSMRDVGIFPGDVLVVDRSLQVRHGDVVIVALNGELAVKTLELRPQVRLVAQNSAYAPIVVPEEAQLEIFGVVTNVIHTLRRA